MKRSFLLIAAGLLMVPVSAGAQDRPRFELHGSAAASRVFRAEDESFGTALGLGAGFAWELVPRWAVGVEGSVVRSLTPRMLICAPPPGVTCTGAAREGVLDASVLSVSVAKFFGKHPIVEPFLLLGYGLVRSHSVSSITTARADAWTIDERESRGFGTGLTGGGGLRIRLGDSVTIRPEWRVYDGSVLGSANLAVMRTSVAAGYGW